MEDMAFFTTIGGRPEDSKNFSLVVENVVRRREFVANAEVKIGLHEGVHLDWNYPGDACSSAADVAKFVQLVAQFRLASVPVMISVPPNESRMGHYSLNETVHMAEFVIVKTHTLTLPGFVGCSGVRPIAARVFNKIRDQLNRTVWHKIGYSVSVGAETFTSKEENLWVPSSGPSSWDNYTLQPGKAHVGAAFCTSNVSFESDFLECGFTSRSVGNGTYLIATLHSELSMANRIKHSYDDGMGISSVMAYDIDLDDFEGLCGAQKSPGVRSLAIGYF
ncbi:endochitinase-like [Amblyomma americanum]